MKKVLFIIFLILPFISFCQIRKIYIHPQTAVFLTHHLRECDSIKRQYLLTQRDLNYVRNKMKSRDSMVQKYMYEQDSVWRNESSKQNLIISNLHNQNQKLIDKNRKNKIISVAIISILSIFYIIK